MGEDRLLPVSIGAPGQSPTRLAEAFAPLLLQMLLYADRKIFEAVDNPLDKIISSQLLHTTLSVLILFAALYLLLQLVRMVQSGQRLWPAFALDEESPEP